MYNVCSIEYRMSIISFTIEVIQFSIMTVLLCTICSNALNYRNYIKVVFKIYLNRKTYVYGLE